MPSVAGAVGASALPRSSRRGSSRSWRGVLSWRVVEGSRCAAARAMARPLPGPLATGARPCAHTARPRPRGRHAVSQSVRALSVHDSTQSTGPLQRYIRMARYRISIHRMALRCQHPAHSGRRPLCAKARGCGSPEPPPRAGSSMDLEPALRPAQAPPARVRRIAGTLIGRPPGRLVRLTGAPSRRGPGGAVHGAPRRIAACGRYTP